MLLTATQSLSVQCQKKKKGGEQMEETSILHEEACNYQHSIPSICDARISQTSLGARI